MFKFLLLAFTFWLVFRILKGYQNQISRKQSPTDEAASQPKQTENMVQCAHCGVHLPQNESYLSKQLYYCSQAHMDLHTPTKKD